MAESEGFKPPIPEKGIPDFESSAIVHSANSPLVCGCKVTKFFRNYQNYWKESFDNFVFNASACDFLIARRISQVLSKV